MSHFPLFLITLFVIARAQVPNPILQELEKRFQEFQPEKERAQSWADTLISLPNNFLQSFSNSSSQTPGCGKPPAVPLGIVVKQVEFLNWAEQIHTKGLWTAEPENPNDVVALSNWALKHGYLVRPRGYMHSWAPLTITATTPCTKVLLVDTTKYLTQIRMLPTNDSDPYAPNQVYVQTGAHWEDLLTFLEMKGFGIFSYPAVGKMTLGGTLAIGAHGTGYPTKGAKIAKGFRTGSISNIITSLDAVVWDYEKSQYVLKTFDRYNDDIRALLVHLGRAFITSVTLMVDENYNLRCQSITTIKAETLFSRDHDNENVLANYVEQYDRVEAQYFPHTDKTWLKLWTEEKTRAGTSLGIDMPYPYTHGRQVFRPLDRMVALLASGITRLTPIISRMTFELGVSGVALTRTADVWGPAKNSLLYYHHGAHKFISLGFNVLTTRPNIQKVVNLCYLFYSRLSDEMATKGKWPMNQPLEFRITGLDKTEVINGRTIRPPALSFLREVEDHPEYDVAVFLGLHYFPGTPNVAEFMRDWETFLFSTFQGQYATARVEWAKTWGFDGEGPWVNATVYNDLLPRTYGSEWNWAVAKLNELDPNRIFTNEFVDRLVAPV